MRNKVLSPTGLSQIVLICARRLPWRDGRRPSGCIGGTGLGCAARGAPTAAATHSMDDRVGEAREVRVDTPQIPHGAQKQITLFGHALGPVRLSEPTRGGCSAQEAYAERRRGRLELAKLYLAGGQTPGVTGLGLQEHGEREPQTLEQFAVPGVYSLELLRREHLAPLDASYRELD